MNELGMMVKRRDCHTVRGMVSESDCQELTPDSSLLAL